MFRYRLSVPPSVVPAAVMSAVFLVAFAMQPATSMRSQPTPPPTPPAQPTAVASPQQTPIQGEPAVTPATGGAITQDDIQRYAQSHPIPFNMTQDRGSIILVARYTSQQLVALLGTSTGVPDATSLWLVEFQGQFTFPGSSQQADGLRFTTAFEVFIADTGNLLMEGGLNTPISGTPTPGGSPTATPVGVATATPPPPATATPQPPATATPAPVPHTCTLLKSGAARLNVDIGYFDFDAGTASIAVSAASDLHYQSGSPAGTFTAINGAALFDWGTGSPPCADYLTVAYVPGGSATVKANETYMVRTNGGHIAVFTVTTFSTDIISINWATYSVS
jgi:hypothetical protein